MEEITKEEKTFLAKKFNEFRVAGLKSYGAYLEQQHRDSADKPLKASYHRYIAKELERNSEEIKRLS